ncbi:MAG: kinase, partial [Candidatus Omnitrophota bacterium]
AEFGRLLNESWQVKKHLSSKVTNPQVDALYASALKHGAIGGKLLGAGGGGFMLLFVRPGDRQKVAKGLKGFLEVKFKFENDGSQVIYYNPQEA